MLGGTGLFDQFSGAVNFNNCESNATAGYELGFDYNGNGVYDADRGAARAWIFFRWQCWGLATAVNRRSRLEALIQPTTTAGNQEIICTDSDASSRGFQFRITSGALAISVYHRLAGGIGAIPTTRALTRLRPARGIMWRWFITARRPRYTGRSWIPRSGRRMCWARRRSLTLGTSDGVGDGAAGHWQSGPSFGDRDISGRALTRCASATWRARRTRCSSIRRMSPSRKIRSVRTWITTSR